jgi:NitT/TauT family transport system substrate-binding protein
MRGLTIAAVLACALLSLCWTPAPAGADESLSIIAGNASPGIFDLLEIVAAGAGFYQAEHLTVTKDYASSASTAAQLVAVAKADVASLSVEPVLQGYEKGLRLVFFLSRQSRYSYVMAVTSDSPIRLIGDFKGAQIGEPNTGSAAEVSARSMLAGAGLGPNDYTFVPIGTGAVGMSAIVAHRVAGLAYPNLEIVTDTVVGHLNFRVFRHPILKDIGNVGYAVLPATLATKADALRHFSRAIVEAALFVRVNPAAAARLYLQGTGQKTTPDALAVMTRVLTLLEDDLPAADAGNKRIGAMSVQGLGLYSRFLVDAGMAHQVVPGPAVVTDRFIGYANDFDHRALIARAKSMH